MSAERQFKAGDEVAVLPTFGPPHIQRVARVMKRFVELDDSTRWDHRGSFYPAARIPFGMARIEHATQEHRDQAERARLLARIERAFDPYSNERDDLSLVSLRAIVALLNEAQS